MLGTGERVRGTIYILLPFSQHYIHTTLKFPALTKYHTKPVKDTKSEASFHVPWVVHTGRVAPEPSPFGMPSKLVRKLVGWNRSFQILRTRRRGDLPKMTGLVCTRAGASIPVSHLPRSCHFHWTRTSANYYNMQLSVNQNMMYCPIRDISTYV